MEHDGYPLNPGRNLLAPPPLPENDLPLASMVLPPERDFQPIMNGYEGHERTLLQTILELQHSANSPIVIIRVPKDTILADLRHFAVQKDSQLEHHLITQMPKDDQTYRLAIPLQTQAGILQSISLVTDMAAWRRNLYQLAEEDYLEEDLPSGDHLFGRAIEGQMFAITREGHLLGFSVPFTNLSVDTYTLAASNYLPTTIDVAVVPPIERVEKLTTVADVSDEIALLLQTLRQDLLQAEQQIMHLQERLKVPDVIETPLPSLAHSPEHSMILNYLGTEQQLYWQELRKHIEVTPQDQDTYAIPFTPEELKISYLSQVGIHQMLQLLEGLGLLIQVSSRLSDQLERNENAYEQEKDQTRIAYRRITNRDICSPKEHPWSK